MGNLILIRHGQTGWNAPGDNELLRSWQDIPLNEEGWRESVRVAEQIKHHPVSVIYTSDLLRARQTAESIQKTTGAELIVTPALRPWNLGTLAGRKVSEVLPMVKQLQKNPAQPAPGGEPLSAFCQRYSKQLKELVALAESSELSIVAVTHIRNFLWAPTILAGGDPSQTPFNGGARTGSFVVINQKNDMANIYGEHETQATGTRLAS